MKMCKPHWQMMRDEIDARGLTPLVAKSGEAAAEQLLKEANGETATFDPLMSMNNHWFAEGLRCGGLYLMAKNEDGSNDGEYCPLCEFEKHAKDFVAKEAVGGIADQMKSYALEQNLIPPVQ